MKLLFGTLGIAASFLLGLAFFVWFGANHFYWGPRHPPVRAAQIALEGIAAVSTATLFVISLRTVVRVLR